MATDWPGHGATNRHPHLLWGCGPPLWFTANNDPPFVYRLNSGFADNPEWWTWSSTSANLGILRDDLHAKWLRSDEEFPDVKLRSLRFLTQGNPPTHHVILTLAHFTDIQVSEAENVIDLGFPEGHRLERGTIFIFPEDNWVELTNFPLDEGIPNVYIEARPKDCVPDWEFGNPLP